MTDRPPTVSVVSLSYNRCANVAELLQSLQRQTYRDVEVILVDNASQDGTADMVRRDFPEVRLIANPTNLGMVAYNLGFAAARGEIIVVVDDDGLPGTPDWLAQIVDRFERNPRLGALSTTIRMRDTGLLAYDSPQFVPEVQSEGGYPGVAFNGTGAALRRSAFRQVGGYPDYFFRTYLELHLCSRLINRGWQVRHFPEIETWHSRISDTSNRPYSYYGLRNYLWYVWQLYPTRNVMPETIHDLAKLSKAVVLNRATIRDGVRAFWDAYSGVNRALSHRGPVSSTALGYLRHVRRHGNWHGIAPQHRAFDAQALGLEG